MTSHMRICFCVNDPNNGVFAGKVSSISVGLNRGSFMDIDLVGFPAPPFRDTGDHIVFLGKRWPIKSYSVWYGNWCWDSVTVEPRVGLNLLRRMRRDVRFRCTGGPEHAYNWFNFTKRTSR